MRYRCVVVVVVVALWYLPFATPANRTSATPNKPNSEGDTCNEGDEGCICFYEDVDEDEEENNEINTDEGEGEGKSRQKRFLFFGADRRLTLPPGAVLILTPTFSMPLRRYPPEVFSSAFRNATSATMTVSIPMTVDFDVLGVTSDLNRFGILSLFRKRRRRRRQAAAGAKLANDIVESGGERPAMYAAVEGILGRMGLAGQPCLLRTVCEMFQAPLVGHGFIGELLHLFLSPSRSPSEQKGRLEAYLKAEQAGRTTGDCSAYHTACPKSLFTDPGPPMQWGFEKDDEHEEGTCSLPGTRY